MILKVIRVVRMRKPCINQKQPQTAQSEIWQPLSNNIC